MFGCLLLPCLFLPVVAFVCLFVMCEASVAFSLNVVAGNLYLVVHDGVKTSCKSFNHRSINL